jgi:hypothetical protein
MRRKKFDYMHREYRRKRRTKIDIFRYIFQLPSFERLDPEE